MNIYETKQAEEVKALKAERDEANQRIQTAYEMLRFGKDELKPADMGDLLLCGAAQTVGALNGMDERIKELDAENKKLKRIINNLMDVANKTLSAYDKLDLK
jgi:uncharacterized coiled-coil DUF342 family protein